MSSNPCLACADFLPIILASYNYLALIDLLIPYFDRLNTCHQLSFFSQAIEHVLHINVDTHLLTSCTRCSWIAVVYVSAILLLIVKMYHLYTLYV